MLSHCVESYGKKMFSCPFFLTKSFSDSLYNDYEKGDAMYYELYIDSLFLVNFVMNLYLLLLVNQSFMRTATRVRLVLGAGVGAGMYLVPFFFGGAVWLKMLLGFLAGTVLMIAVAFRIRSLRAFWKICEKLFLYSLLMGGTLLLVMRQLSRLPGLTVGIFMVLGGGALLGMGIGYLQQRGKDKSYLCRATLIYKNNKVTVMALLDSGNSLVEPISGKPVSVIDRKVFLSLWKEEALYRAIPYHSIGRKRGIMPGYLLPELRIEADGMIKICKDIYVAVTEEDICRANDGVRMIVNPELIG